MEIKEVVLEKGYKLKGIVSGQHLEGLIYTPEGKPINNSYGYYNSPSMAELWLLLNN